MAAKAKHTVLDFPGGRKKQKNPTTVYSFLIAADHLGCAKWNQTSFCVPHHSFMALKLPGKDEYSLKQTTNTFMDSTWLCLNER